MLPGAEQRRRPRERPAQPEHGRPRPRDDPKLERGRDAELPAARAAQRPEQVGLGVRVGRDGAPVRQHDLRGHQLVARQPVRPAQHPEPAAQQQPCDPDLGPASARDRAAACVEGVVDPPEPRSWRPRAPYPSPTATPSIGATSISTPPVDERPAKQCPPLRTASGRPRASASASATSVAVAQRAIAAGRTSAKRASAGRRAASYASDPGRSNSMAVRRPASSCPRLSLWCSPVLEDAEHVVGRRPSRATAPRTPQRRAQP